MLGTTSNYVNFASQLVAQYKLVFTVHLFTFRRFPTGSAETLCMAEKTIIPKSQKYILVFYVTHMYIYTPHYE